MDNTGMVDFIGGEWLNRIVKINGNQKIGEVVGQDSPSLRVGSQKHIVYTEKGPELIIEFKDGTKETHWASDCTEVIGQDLNQYFFQKRTIE